MCTCVSPWWRDMVSGFPCHSSNDAEELLSAPWLMCLRRAGSALDAGGREV